MVRCMLADSDFPSSIWGELFMVAAYLKNRTPHEVLRIEMPVKMRPGEGADLLPLCVIQARTYVHVIDSRKATAWEGSVYGYSEENKPYRVWIAKTHRVVESRIVTFIEPPSYLLPPLSNLSPLQHLVPPSWDINNDTLDNEV